jgi:hypothetical protein
MMRSQALFDFTAAEIAYGMFCKNPSDNENRPIAKPITVKNNSVIRADFSDRNKGIFFSGKCFKSSLYVIRNTISPAMVPNTAPVIRKKQ